MNSTSNSRRAMMIRVYFSDNKTMELVAKFVSEDHYIACLPTLKELAKQEGWTDVTETEEA